MPSFWQGALLGAGLMVAVLLVVWWLIGEAMARRDARPRRMHSLKDSQERTRPLRYEPTLDRPAPMERDGGQAQRLPQPEDMPLPPMTVAGHDDRPMDDAPAPWPYIHPQDRRHG